jgi:hypothetical protein
MGRKSSSGTRFNLGEPWDTDLNAFCAAVLDIDRTKVARKAIAAYIRQFLSENEGVSREFERIRAELIGRKSEKVTVLHPGGK